MSRQVPHAEDIATGTPTLGQVPISAGPGLAPAWGAAGGGGGLTLIQQIVVAVNGDPVSFAAIPGTYTHLLLLGRARVVASTLTGIHLLCNADTGANYAYAEISNDLSPSTTGNASAFNAGAASSIRIGRIGGGAAPAGSFSAYRLLFSNYASTVFWKEFLGESTSLVSLADGPVSRHTGGWWASTAAITQLDVAIDGGGAFAAGSVFALYGL